MIPESVGGSCDEEPRRSATRRHDNPHIAEAKQPRRSQCGSSASARFSLRGLRKRPGRKTGLHPRRRLSAPPQPPRLLLRGQGVAACPPQAARRSDTERAVGEARSPARPPRGRPLHLDAGDKASQRARRTRASTWRLAPYQGGDLKGEHGKESERHPRSAWPQSPGMGGQAGQVQGAARLRPP